MSEVKEMKPEVEEIKNGKVILDEVDKLCLLNLRIKSGSIGGTVRQMEQNHRLQQAIFENEKGKLVEELKKINNSTINLLNRFEEKYGIELVEKKFTLVEETGEIVFSTD